MLAIWEGRADPGVGLVMDLVPSSSTELPETGQEAVPLPLPPTATFKPLPGYRDARAINRETLTLLGQSEKLPWYAGSTKHLPFSGDSAASSAELQAPRTLRRR